MPLLGYIAQVVLTMAGFSLGATVGRRGRSLVLPSLLDVPLLFLLCSGAVVLRGYTSHWPALGIAICGGFLASAAVAGARPRTPPAEARGIDDPDGASSPRGFLASIRAAWKRRATAMGSFQGRMILAVFYFTLLAPFGLVHRLSAGSILSARNRAPAWHRRDADACTLESARNQF